MPKIKLKSVITISITFALIIFTYMKIIGPELFIASASSVYACYFSKDKKPDAEDK